MSILPDTDFVVQAIKRMHYQASKWYQSDLQTIYDVPFEGNGWICCVKPGEQLPTSQKPRKPLRRKASNDESFADIEHRNQRHRNHQRKKRKGSNDTENDDSDISNLDNIFGNEETDRFVL